MVLPASSGPGPRCQGDSPLRTEPASGPDAVNPDHYLLDQVRRSLADRYRVDEVVGSGGMAVVFSALDLRHQRRVAIKVLRIELAQSIGAQRFVQEIQIAARLAHPHILPLLDSGWLCPTDDCDCPYYVMPLVEGETLRQRLERGPIPPDEAFRILTEIATAVEYAHRQGVIHRDLKPENVMFLEGLAVIADFGIARALDVAGGARLTRTGLMLGTPQYMSPEQITGEGEVDQRTDIYALGCVLFEMLAGTVPFGGSLREVLARRLSEPPPGVRRVGAPVSTGVDQAIQRAMATDAGDRFGSVAEFMAALRAGDAGRVVRRPRAPALVFGAPLLAIGVLGLVWLFSHRGEAPTRTVAIRPLVNVDRDSSTLHLSDGIHEAVADLLRGVPRLAVTAPTLVHQILRESPDLDFRAFANRVGASAVLTWTLRRQGDSLRLRAELVSAGDGRMIWSQTYDRAATDVVSLPAEIVRPLTQAVGLALTGPEAARVARLPTRDPIAYDAYLRGRRVWVRATPLGGANARTHADSILYYAERALERDPGFAGAHFLRAAFYSIAAVRGWRTPFGPTLDTAAAVVRKALSLDSTLADAYVVQGIVDFFGTDRWEDAGRALRRAVELNPDLATARFYYGMYLGEVERQLDSGIAQLRRAAALEVQPIFLNTLGDLLLRARRLDSAAVVLREAMALEPSSTGQRLRLIRVLEELGRYDEALRYRRAGPDSAGTAEFADALAREGPAGYQRVLRASILREIDALTARLAGPRADADTVPPTPEHRIARLYARLGDWPHALDWVLREHQRRPGRLVYVLANPDFDGIRTDPRFLPLVRSAGLESLLERLR